jgi:hypothetical protein
VEAKYNEIITQSNIPYSIDFIKEKANVNRITTELENICEREK